MILEATDYALFRGLVIGLVLGLGIAYKYVTDKDKKQKPKE